MNLYTPCCTLFAPRAWSPYVVSSSKNIIIVKESVTITRTRFPASHFIMQAINI